MIHQLSRVGTERRRSREETSTDLLSAVASFCALENEVGSKPRLEVYHAALASVHSICAAVLGLERSGMNRQKILRQLAPARAIHARSPFVKRLQDWPRGYPGDFETVDYLCAARNQAPPGTLEHCCEQYSLNLPVAQQHRNKVQEQAFRVLETVHRVRRPRILSLACGSCPDLRRLLSVLRQGSAEFVVNDADVGALEAAREALLPLGERCTFLPGNALKVVRQARQIGRFDLVIAGGLFDYLDDRQASHLIRSVYRRLVAPGGAFFFTNMAAGNPYRCLIEYMGNWFLRERAEGDIAALCERAGVSPQLVSINRDPTGLALLVDV